jgi:hypothetical protein
MTRDETLEVRRGRAVVAGGACDHAPGDFPVRIAGECRGHRSRRFARRYDDQRPARDRREHAASVGVVEQCGRTYGSQASAQDVFEISAKRNG